MSPLNLPDNIKLDARDNLIKWLDKTLPLNILSEREIDQIQRVIDYIDVVEQGHTRAELDKNKHFHDFKSFYEQYDIRRNKDFRKTFPMLVDWYDSLEVDYTIPDVMVSKGGLTGWESGEYSIPPKIYIAPTKATTKKLI